MVKFKMTKSKMNVLKVKKEGKWTFVYIFMIALVAFTSLPLVYLISTAFKPLNELFLFPPRFFVKEPTLKNFTDLMLSLSSSTVPFTRYILNSLYVTVITVILTVFVSTLGAYSLVKHNPPGTRKLFKFIIATMMFSPYVTQIPRYLVVNSIGLVNKIAALIIPNIAVSYNFFLIKQFVEQFPNELLEAARIDGAGEFYTYWKIVMPVLTPAWSTLIVFSYVSSWNDYFSPLIYINNQALKTLPLALRTISGGGASIGRAGAVAAATMLMTIPTVVVFTSMQNKVMETMVHSGIKG
ncbi:MAG TPA: carbohydrate ABC transporter permease [Clostridiales bacterium]|nr:carbohydrate ABC transporter permease [Clostridiales bacterium]